MPVHHRNTSAGLAAAQAAPRCQHTRYNGAPCGAPALQGKSLCRFHLHAFASGQQMPFVEDAAAVQLALMRVIRGLEEKTMDHKSASLLLYALQIACMNMKRLEAFFAVTDTQAEEQRERSLLEELMAKLEDDEFIAELNGEDVGDIQAAAHDSRSDNGSSPANTQPVPAGAAQSPQATEQGSPARKCGVRGPVNGTEPASAGGTSDRRKTPTNHGVPPLRADALRSG